MERKGVGIVVWGNNKSAFFKDNQDRIKFLDL